MAQRSALSAQSGTLSITVPIINNRVNLADRVDDREDAHSPMHAAEWHQPMTPTWTFLLRTVSRPHSS